MKIVILYVDLVTSVNVLLVHSICAILERQSTMFLVKNVLLAFLTLFYLVGSSTLAKSPFALENTALPNLQVSPPTLIAEYKSSSGATIIQYYHYVSPLCGVTNCNFNRGIITTYPNFNLTDVFLSGFSIQTDKSEDTIARLKAEVQQFRYMPQTGDLEISVNAQIGTGTQQGYSYEIIFGIVLTDPSVAHLSGVSGGCADIATCQIKSMVANVVPSSMQFIGLGVHEFQLGSDSGPIFINSLGISNPLVNVLGTDIEVEQTCAFHDAALSNRMFCEYSAATFAFDPSELDVNDSVLSPRLVISNTGVAGTLKFLNSVGAASGSKITGALDALEGLNFSYPAGTEEAIWAVEAWANSVNVAGPSSTQAESDYSLFLGTIFGDRTSTAPFDVEFSRTVGLLL